MCGCMTVTIFQVMHADLVFTNARFKLPPYYCKVTQGLILEKKPRGFFLITFFH